MTGEESVTSLRPVIQLPIALYCSNGLVFELYDGDRACRRPHIVWERLKTMEERDSASSSVKQSRD